MGIKVDKRLDKDSPNTSDDVNVFPGLQQFYIDNINNLKICLININSVRHKLGPLTYCIHKGYIDILCIQDTKIDG